MSKNWKLKPKAPEELLEQNVQYSLLLTQLLYNRGLTEKAEIETFLHPQYEAQYDPFLFQDMDKAVRRIWEALEKNQGICIYGDYDADAVTANAVLQQTFLYLGKKIDSYIPDRFTEGYGLNLQAFQKIRDQGAAVVITVDCGTNSVEVADFCKQNNIDLIITDHHEIIGPKPKAFALINPKNSNDKYPYQEITGVGVAFKLAKAILSRQEKVAATLKTIHGEEFAYVPGFEKWLLDLVAIGTVADCHSLLGENRILVTYGLKVLQKTRWPGLRALIHAAQLNFSEKLPDTYTLGFILAPRLNAAGRLEHADTALHLLLEQDPTDAATRANNLEKINIRRQEQTLRIVSEAKAQAELISDRKVIIVAGEGWNKGIVGLVAGRLVEEYHKPVMVLEKGAVESTGSARTVGEFDVVESLKHASEYLLRFGGHKQAAGLTLKTAHFEVFYSKILEYAEINLTEEDLLRELTLDAQLTADDLNAETFSAIAAMEPFGVGNPKPKFLLSGTEIISMRWVGKQNQHLQMKLKAGEKTIDSIMFSASDFAKNLKIGDTIDVACELVEDTWNGSKNLKLRLVDLRIAQVS